MILSVGRRTDIPAFYSDWFFNRIKDGYTLCENPLFPNESRKNQNRVCARGASAIKSSHLNSCIKKTTGLI